MKVNELFEGMPGYRSWAMLPAGKVLFDKNKVTPDDIHGQWPGDIGLYLHHKGDKDVVIMVPGRNNKEGDNAPVHHDQSGRSMGSMTAIGHLKKTKDGWEVESSKKIPGLETPEEIKKFKAPLLVFK